LPAYTLLKYSLKLLQRIFIRLQVSGDATGPVDEIGHAVILWYREHRDRDLPWKKAGDRWAMLVATLLRKTTTSQVAKAYGEFLRRYPISVVLAWPA